MQTQTDLRQDGEEVEGGGGKDGDASPVHPTLPGRGDHIPVGRFDESAGPLEKIPPGKSMVCRAGFLPTD